MGVNNRQRRAAKQRERARRRSQRPAPDPTGEWARQEPDAYDAVETAVRVAVQLLMSVPRAGESPTGVAARLLESARPHPAELVVGLVGDLLVRQTDALLGGGWSRSDLEELVRRNAGEEHRATVLAAVGEIDRSGPRARLATTAALGSALVVVALMSRTPLLDGDHVSAPTASASEHPRLARVRALLAKAESTDFDEEAEALSAKAQELITRYALEGLIGVVDAGSTGRDPMTVRRIWLDPPYVRAKSALVSAVAQANRCRAASSESLSFCVVVGLPRDLEAVDLLVTSLLVQAGRAMLRSGRRTGGGAGGRARSFRHAFLLAYASRIGERLRAANDAVADETMGRLLVVRDHEQRVASAFDAMVTHQIARSSSISNGAGWAAGRAAADLAQLDVRAGIDERAG